MGRGRILTLCGPLELHVEFLPGNWALEGTCERRSGPEHIHCDMLVSCESLDRVPESELDVRSTYCCR